MYFIFNNTSGGFAVTVKVSGQTGILVPNGKKVVLTCNGTDIVEAHTAIVGNATMGGTLGVTGAGTFSSTLGVTGTSTLAAVNATGNVTLGDAVSDVHTTNGLVQIGQGTFAARTGVKGVIAAGSTTGDIHCQLGDAGATWQWINAANSLGVMILSNAGNLSVTGTLGVTGLITRSASAATGTLMSTHTGTTTGFMYSDWLNTSGRTMVGVESSVGGTLSAGTTAYDSIVGAVTATGLSLTTNNTVRLRIDSAGAVTIPGAASTRAMLSVGSGSSTLAGWAIGNAASGYAGIWSTAITPAAANFALESNGGLTLLNGTTSSILTVNNVNTLVATSGAVAITGTLGVTTGAAVGGATPGAGGLAFPATAVAVADANTLDDYEEYTSASTACTGALLVSVVWRVVKIGKQITLHSDSVYGTGQSTTNFTLGLTLPAAYYPVAVTRLPIVNVIVNNASQANVGVLIVSSTTGIMTVYRDATLATSWGAAANTGIEGAFSVSWLTA